MTTIYLATLNDGNQISALQTFADKPKRPALLISFAYLKSMKKPIADGLGRHRLMLDSGAFTAFRKGKKVDMSALIHEMKSGSWNEMAALDVIGDPEASLKNALAMQAAGLDVIPVFHYGEPWEFLAEYKARFHKVGFGGVAGASHEQDLLFDWVDQCFSRIWPFRAHMFGRAQEKMLMRFPFHSCDSTGWTGAVRFGRWNFAGGQHLGLTRPKCSKATGPNYLLPEIYNIMQLQDRVQSRWRKEFEVLRWVDDVRVGAR